MSESISKNSIGVVILAAGDGKRMKSELPKVMHELRGKPLIDHVVGNVEASGVADRIVVVVSPKHTLVQDCLGDRAEYVIQQEQLGTGHAAAQAQAILRGQVGHVITLYGDMPLVSGQSLKALAEKHVAGETAMSMLTAAVSDFEDWRVSLYTNFGRIVRSEDGEVAKSVEFRDTTEEEKAVKELSTCIYCFKTDWLFDHLARLDTDNAQGEYYLTDLVGMAVEERVGISTAHIDAEEAIGINSKEDLERAEIV